MYRIHKFFIGSIFLLTFLGIYYFDLNYKTIASDGITVVSIVLAIYMTSFSSLISSDLAEKMKNRHDKKIPRKSQLGVLRSYLNTAVAFGISNIVLSCLCLLLERYQKKTGKAFDIAYKFLSSAGGATLAVNLFLMFLLYKFMVNRQMWNK